MTILYSFYTSDGIVFAADRMITKLENGRRIYVESELPKVLAVPKLGVHDVGGVVGYFGLADLAGIRTTNWLRRITERHANSGGSRRVKGFVDRLVEELRRPATIREEWADQVLGFHIGGFERFGRFKLPVFWFVRNCDLAPDGTYFVSNRGWEADEQFLNRDFKSIKTSDLRALLRQIQARDAVPFWYRNGDLPSFTAVTDALKAAVTFTARLKGYGPPEGYDSWRELASTLVYTSRNLAGLTYRRGQVSIGGKADVKGLPWP